MDWVVSGCAGNGFKLPHLANARGIERAALILRDGTQNLLYAGIMDGFLLCVMVKVLPVNGYILLRTGQFPQVFGSSGDGNDGRFSNQHSIPDSIAGNAGIVGLGCL